jgi:DNA polymerase-3 subunit beta
MIAYCYSENLSRGLSMVSRAVNARSTLSVLGNVMIQAEDKHLILSATDLTIGVRVRVDATVTDPGSITIPAKLLSEFIAALPTGERVDLKLNARTMTLNIKCARYDSNFKGVSATEFPLIPSSENQGGAISMDVNTLRKVISRVAFCASPDESRPALAGVKVMISNKKIEMVATDGFRLAIASTKHEGSKLDDATEEVLIPAKSLAELSRIIGLLPYDMNDTYRPVDIVLPPTGHNVIFRMAGVDFVSQVITNEYPKYQSIIPKSHASSMTVDTKALLRALRVSNLFARDSSNIVRFAGTPSDGQTPDSLVITSTSSEMGDNIASLDITMTGPEVVIAFNGRYMLDVLNAIGAPQIVLETSRSTAPGVIRPVGDDNYLCIVMPMHDGAGKK